MATIKKHHSICVHPFQRTTCGHRSLLT
ncbi:MAG: hypothetical protein JNM55_21045 [Anaerolineales bacterium]|nr:hypothetical protein [Anaerolineales bacterium]